MGHRVLGPTSPVFTVRAQAPTRPSWKGKAARRTCIHGARTLGWVSPGRRPPLSGQDQESQAQGRQVWSTTRYWTETVSSPEEASGAQASGRLPAPS